jgi:hypothetical protein
MIDLFEANSWLAISAKSALMSSLAFRESGP